MTGQKEWHEEYDWRRALERLSEDGADLVAFAQERVDDSDAEGREHLRELRSRFERDAEELRREQRGE